MTENAQPEKSLDELASTTARMWTRLRVGVDVELSPMLLAHFARLLSKCAGELADALDELPLLDPVKVQMSSQLSGADAQALASAIGLPPDEIPEHWTLET